MTGATLPPQVRLGSLTGPLVDMAGDHSSLPRYRESVLSLLRAPSPAKESLVAAQEH